jgi:hypothetical protein
MMSIFEVFLDVVRLVTFQYRAPPSARHHLCRQAESNEVTQNAKHDSDEIDGYSNEPQSTNCNKFSDF